MSDSMQIRMENVRVELAQTNGKVALVANDIKALTDSLSEKHQQNRNDIHDIRNTLQDVVHQISSIRKIVDTIQIKQTVWAGIAGVVVAILVKLVDIPLHKFFGH